MYMLFTSLTGSGIGTGLLGVAYFILVHVIYLLTGSGIGTGLLGIAYFANIHHLYYFIIVQICSGVMQV